MADEFVSEVKHIKGKGDKHKEQPRDPSMVDGERAETLLEKERRRERQKRPAEAPIIPKDVT